VKYASKSISAHCRVVPSSDNISIAIVLLTSASVISDHEAELIDHPAPES
jgi:hypothetical protein